MLGWLEARYCLGQLWVLICVGAGLPAMPSLRYVSHTAVMLSQASQLPHKPAPTKNPALRLGFVVLLRRLRHAVRCDE
ncbi:hypothetical protein PspR76_24085 [Pseudomonas sp. R76]|nr:hypothetical protein PspR76_24085 [Pseudomonas sp. R76]